MSKLCDVPPATLRAWERRYGVPAPARTASAYRLYSEEDVALIRKMRELVKGGMAAAEAARTVLVSPRAAPGEAEDAGSPFAGACDRIVNAALLFDADRLEREVGRTLVLGSATAIFEGTLGPALRRIGDLWHEGVLTVAQEHMASQTIGTMVHNLLRLTQPNGSSRRVVLACFPEEDHVLGICGAGLSFTSWGFRTLYLGARTPPAEIARVVEVVKPDFVALSATVSLPGPHARELVDEYAAACDGAVWVVGGAAAPALRSWIEARGGIVAGDDRTELRRHIERALRVNRRRRADE